MSPGRWALALLLAGPAASAAASPGLPQQPEALLERLREVWAARDADGYVSLWIEPQRAAESSFALDRFSADESELTLFPPTGLGSAAPGFEFRAELFLVNEPRGRAEQWRFRAVRSASGWQLVARERVGSMDGLLHLSLAPVGYRAEGLKLVLEDFELSMRDGTLFTSPESIGPTVLVFVGTGEVRFTPRPPTERQQLEQFCGRPELVDRVDRAFVRINPGDLERVFEGLPLEPDPGGRAQLADAVRFYEEHTYRTFVLDARTPRSPWWLVPSRGEAVVTFDARKRGVLTLSISATEPEAISLIDRDGRRQINLYPRAGQSVDYDEDEGRSVDVLHRQLRARFEPGARRLAATALLRLNMRQPVQTLRLRLDDRLEVRSVSAPGAGELLFFRVRGQDTLMISLGMLAGTVGDVTLSVRYGGRLEPGPIRDEVLQLFDRPGVVELTVPIEPVLVYSNLSAWYPRVGRGDFATSALHFDVPSDHMAVSGGRLVSDRIVGKRRLLEFEQDEPGRYSTVAIGRLHLLAEGRAGDVPIHGWAVSRAARRVTSDVAAAEQIVGFFERSFGPYPFSELNVVGLEGETPGGHSPPGMVIMSHRPLLLLRQRLRDDPAQVSDADHFFLAHELAHQWWGHGVAPQNYRERWISEAFAHYAAALWVREVHGEDEFRSILKQLGNWARRKTDEGPIHLGYRLGHIEGDPQVFRAIVYDKGAYVLHMLRGIVGEQAFRDALTGLQQGFRFRKLGTRQVREALEAASGRELGAYFDTWVLGTKLPTLRYARRTRRVNGAREVEVEVRPTGLPGPVPLEILIEVAGEKRRERVVLPPQGGRWQFPVPEKPRKVEVNDDRGLLAEMKKL